MSTMMNVLFLFAAGILHFDSLHALPVDICHEGLTANAQNLGPYLHSGNKEGFRELCTLYGIIVEQCEFTPEDKLLIQQSYEKSCKSEKVQRWLASRGSLAVRQPTFTILTLSCVVILLISRTR